MFYQPNTRYAAMLLGTLAIQSMVLVHALPGPNSRWLNCTDVDDASQRASTRWFPCPEEDDEDASERTSAAGSLDLTPRQGIDIPPALAGFPSGPLNQFLRLISTLPEGSAALDAVGKILTPLQQVLADSAGIETTRNDLAENAACAAVTVVFARGTTEPGNVGLVTGPPFFDALSQQLGDTSLAVQGVEYPATFAGFNKNGTEGVPSMTAFINQAINDCPNTKVVMSGYSQGALVVRSTAQSLPAATMAKINSVVTFGDPGNPGTITGAESKMKIFCHDNDAVCKGGFITVDHLTYADDADAAAQFVIGKAGV